MSANDDGEKHDGEREGDVVNENGELNEVWRRQSIIGIWKEKGGKVVTLSARSTAPLLSLCKGIGSETS